MYGLDQYLLQYFLWQENFASPLYINTSEVGSTYGTAGSLVVLLLWVYYSSIILYFGAEFTKAYAIKFGDKIMPNHYAVTVQTVEVETAKESVQENDEQEKQTDEQIKRKADTNKS